MRIPRHFFERDPLTCARELIGARLVCGDCSGIVVETEAYTAVGDEAAHTFSRPSAREFVAEKQPGAAYVYLNYGMYWLANVLVKSSQGDGFVLLRALQPERGIDGMKRRRERTRERDLCSGPGKLTIAMDIGRDDHGGSFVGRGSRFWFEETGGPAEVEEDIRIGITRSAHLPWRYLLRGSEFVSVRKKGG